MLVSERNTDDGDVKQHAEKQVRERDGQSAEKKPNNIHYQRNAAGRNRTARRFFIERQQRHFRQFKRLQTKRNTNDGNHQPYAGKNVFDGNENATKQILRFISKGIDIGKLSTRGIKRTEQWMNHHPRKMFGYKIANGIDVAT